MDQARSQRILRQHVMTDQLLGIDAVPRGAANADHDAVMSEREPTTDMAPSDRAGRAAQLEQINVNEVQSCSKCGLCQSRTQTVFGEGDAAAGLMFIGEGPGQNEDQQGRPFVGRAGELLNKQIAAMGLKREQVYIANLVKCRPPNNRAPTPVEVEACGDYLRRQIQIIQPQVIVTLGGPAVKAVLNTREGVTRIRGQWFTYEGLGLQGPQIPVMPTFHPAYLLRAYTEDNRRRVWSDLQKVMTRLGLDAKPQAAQG